VIQGAGLAWLAVGKTPAQMLSSYGKTGGPMLELLKELGQISERTLSYYYVILLASPVLFVFFQQRSPGYPFWNVLLAVSAPGAVAGLLMWVGLFADRIHDHYEIGVQVDVAWELFIVSWAFPAIWFAPISFAASLFLKRNGKLANAIFVLCSIALILSYLSAAATINYPLN
jgi:hypothetical protein